jgi:hypothetical protein
MISSVFFIIEWNILRAFSINTVITSVDDVQVLESYIHDEDDNISEPMPVICL